RARRARRRPARPARRARPRPAHRRYARQAPRHERHPGSRPPDPHQRRDAPQQLLPLAARVHRDVRDRHPVARLPRARLPPGARLLPAAPAPLRPHVRPGRTRKAAGRELGEFVADCAALMLRTRLATAAIALPALWLIVEYLPPHLFAGFIMAVAALALLEYFAMALPGDAVERTAGVPWGLGIAGGVASQQSDLWGAGLALAVIGGVMFPLLHADGLPNAMHHLGPPLPGLLYMGFFTPH